MPEKQKTEVDWIVEELMKTPPGRRLLHRLRDAELQDAMSREIRTAFKRSLDAVIRKE